ncbi:MAG: response regulator transcription factor [Candidatus Marinimicrobia bacterium]|nr:response regulator transcription factor [Candidatus Neomarinimicrobiota bacterium]
MKILVADDSPLIRERLFKIISKINGVTHIYQATNTTEALTIFRNSHPDVIILDISMPDQGIFIRGNIMPYTSGIDVLEIVKEENPLTKVIMLTNYPSKQFRTVCSNLGADFFFVKSDEFFEIPRVIKDLINNDKH